jgi:formylglycine-generating enzyme required for sulfatase activity
MRAPPWSWIAVLALVPWACLADVYNDKPGVCTTGQTQCVLGMLQTCGVDYQWHGSGSCTGADAGTGGGNGTGGTSPGDAGGPDGEGGTTTEPPSCQGLGTTCGTAQESCCTSKLVMGGTLTRTENGSTTQDTALVPDFRLDRYEVTVGRFRAFFTFLTGNGQIPAGAGAQPGDSSTGWQSPWSGHLPSTDAQLQCDSLATWTAAPAGNENLPINCIEWHTAFAFCAWDGGRLPTEAEWQYAATVTPTPMPPLTYPWGSATPDPMHAVYCTALAGTDTAPCSGTQAPSIAPVGSLSPTGDGPWGHSDLAGNVWEWVLDAPDPYPSSCTSGCYSFAAVDGGLRGIRGGSFLYGSYYLPGALRTSQSETTVKPKQGIRCARSP